MKKFLKVVGGQANITAPPLQRTSEAEELKHVNGHVCAIKWNLVTAAAEVIKNGIECAKEQCNLVVFKEGGLEVTESAFYPPRSAANRTGVVSAQTSLRGGRKLAEYAVGMRICIASSHRDEDILATIKGIRPSDEGPMEYDLEFDSGDHGWAQPSNAWEETEVVEVHHAVGQKRSYEGAFGQVPTRLGPEGQAKAECAEGHLFVDKVQVVHALLL
jgi:hypothetical protein